MNIVYSEEERSGIVEMGKALKFLLEFCDGYEKCRECEFEKACYNLYKVSNELISNGGKDESKY